MGNHCDKTDISTIARYEAEIKALKEEVARLTCTGDCIHNCNCCVAADLRDELTALKEKHRWRKQNEEPAPPDDFVELLDGDELDGQEDGRILGECWLARGYCVTPNSYWRPLVLPEKVEKK